MLNRKLSMAWEKWQFTAAEMARQQFLLAGALTRMLKRKMSFRAVKDDDTGTLDVEAYSDDPTEPDIYE